MSQKGIASKVTVSRVVFSFKNSFWLNSARLYCSEPLFSSIYQVAGITIIWLMLSWVHFKFSSFIANLALSMPTEIGWNKNSHNIGRLNNLRYLKISNAGV